MKLGDILRKIRSRKKLSQQEIADQIGVCQSTYFAWENDRSLPNVKYYLKLITMFSDDLIDLMPENFTVIRRIPNDSMPSIYEQNNQYLYEELASSQKQTILLQQQRIEQLEIENQRLRNQILSLEFPPILE